MSFLEVFVSPAYHVSKEHLFVCNGVATPEQFFFHGSRRFHSWYCHHWGQMLNSCERRDAVSSSQCPASSVHSAVPPTERFGSQVQQQPQPIGWVCRLLHWLKKCRDVFCLFFLPVTQWVKSWILTFNWAQLTFTQHLRTSSQEWIVLSNGPNTHTHAHARTQSKSFFSFGLLSSENSLTSICCFVVYKNTKIISFPKRAQASSAEPPFKSLSCTQCRQWRERGPVGFKGVTLTIDRFEWKRAQKGRRGRRKRD